MPDVETVIIGAGQAGLATAQRLRTRGRECVGQVARPAMGSLPSSRSQARPFNRRRASRVESRKLRGRPR